MIISDDPQDAIHMDEQEVTPEHIEYVWDKVDDVEFMGDGRDAVINRYMAGAAETRQHIAEQFFQKWEKIVLADAQERADEKHMDDLAAEAERRGSDRDDYGDWLYDQMKDRQAEERFDNNDLK